MTKLLFALVFLAGCAPEVGAMGLEGATFSSYQRVDAVADPMEHTVMISDGPGQSTASEIDFTFDSTGPNGGCVFSGRWTTPGHFTMRETTVCTVFDNGMLRDMVIDYDSTQSLTGSPEGMPTSFSAVLEGRCGPVNGIGGASDPPCRLSISGTR